MDTETRAAFAVLGEMMTAGFARVDARMGDMDARMTAGFARADHYFELQHIQHLELSGEVAGLRGAFAELRGEVKVLSARVDALTERVGSLEHEVSQLRDFVTREVAAIRLELRDLRARADQSDELRREIAELAMRVDRLERRN
jgi:predicted RNase H-like nuclease (RuvC/YqgF family)